MPDTLTFNCTITESENNLPVIDLLGSRFPYHDIKRWRTIVGSGNILLNGGQVEADRKVCTGDTLTYRAVDHREPAVSTEIEPVRETPDLLLIGKPAGTPVNRTGLIVYNTFVNILRRHYDQEIHPLHRLDRETSGLILCARSNGACRAFQKQMGQLVSGKYYLAVVHGELEANGLEVDAPLTTRPDSPVRCRMHVDAGGKTCRTILHTIMAREGYSLILAELLTGRRHQIRAHLAHLGYPLVGDKIYSHDGKYFLKRLERDLSGEDYDALGAENHTLHAWAMRLQLPEQPERLRFSKLFSPDMRRYLQLFPDWQEKAAQLLKTGLALPINPKRNLSCI
ncbi:MAG: RluA family pseudouridine synthase [Thermodesulfobacteriota bacterium]